MRSEYLVRDRPPAIPLDPSVPTIMLIVFWLVILDVDLLLSHFFLDLIIVTGCKSIDVTD